MQEKIVCEICGKEYKRITAGHLSLHRLTVDEYKKKYGLTVSEASHIQHSESLAAVHASGNFLTEEGRKSISEKLKKRHRNGFMVGENHWSYNKRRFLGEWIQKDELKELLLELIEQDMIIADIANECQTDDKTMTNWLREFDLQQGIRKGSRCSWWKGGHEKYRGPGWLTTRKQILERDGYECQSCGKTQSECLDGGHALSIHHIVPWRETHDSSPKNLVTLCQSCHSKREWQTGTFSPGRKK